MTKLLTYIKLVGRYITMKFSQVMEMKAHFIIETAVAFFAHYLSPLFSLIIYGATKGFPGWSLGEFIIFQGTSTFALAIAGTTIFTIVFDYSRLIESGYFDMMLLKPLKTIPFMIIKAVNPWWIGELFSGLTIVIYGVIISGIKVTLGGVLLYSYFIFLAVLVYFSFACLILTLNFKYYQVSNLMQIFWQLRSMTNYPISIYGKSVALLFTIVLPLSIANFYPANALIGNLISPLAVLLITASVVAFTMISVAVLSIGMRRYQSVGG